METTPQTTPDDDGILDAICEIIHTHTTLVDQAVRWYHSLKCSYEEGCSCDMAEEYYAGCDNTLLRNIFDVAPE